MLLILKGDWQHKHIDRNYTAEALDTSVYVTDKQRIIESQDIKNILHTKKKMAQEETVNYSYTNINIYT